MIEIVNIYLLLVYSVLLLLLLLNVDIECHVVTADCCTEVLAYTLQSGYVKLNGVVVWQGSFANDNPRGTNTLLIDPFICSAQEIRRFDTYSSMDAATELSNYLQLLNHGSIIVGVSADEATNSLTDDAKSTLQQLGADISDVQYRGSFGFIAQKGFPAKTVLRKALTDAESQLNPAQFSATITGIQRAVRARRLLLCIICVCANI